MNTTDLITHAKRIAKHIKQQTGIQGNDAAIRGTISEAAEFLRIYAGQKSVFFSNIDRDRQKFSAEYVGKITVSVLESFARFLEAGLREEITPIRQAQLDVVSDFLEQAHLLLEQKSVHPAAPAVIIGATLEEFLRTWVETKEISLGNRKPSLETYSQVLRHADLISKQDAKDLLSWGGLRNHAAHGEWSEVAERQRVQLMLEGVNLFMRKYGR